MTPLPSPGGAFFCPPMSRVATIDLGTNTVRLLVVETEGAGRWRVLAQDQVITRLGEGAAASRHLGELPMKRTVECVAAFCRLAVSLGAGEILIVATSAVREAGNRQVFLDLVRGATGRDVRVVPGEEEARLALLGVLSGLTDTAGDLLLMDIGGGSTEFTFARDRQVLAALSVALGVVPLAERYMTRGPVDWGRYADMVREVQQLVARQVIPRIGAAGSFQMIGTAGTVTTLAALDQSLARYDPARVQGYVLRRHRIERLLVELGGMSLAERARLPALDPGRADLIVPGAAICLSAMSAFRASALIVSDYGLREGILIERISGSLSGCR